MEKLSAETISLVALIFAFLSFILTFWHNRRLTSKNTNLQKAIFHMERNVMFEGRLSEWPEAFKLQGVDLREAARDGVTKEQITYLILSLNSLSSYAWTEDISVYDQLQKNAYRQRMFAQEITQKTWKYARRFSSSNYKHVDRYLKETYGVQYDPI